MRAVVRAVMPLVLVTLLLAGPGWYWRHTRAQKRHFHVVHENVLYRSAQLNVEGLKRLTYDYGLRTIITLRQPGDKADAAEEAWASKSCLNFHRIADNRFWDSQQPAREALQQFRAIMSNPDNFPVLIHCQAGTHRTGAFCAIYRMEFQGWTNQQVINEMKAMRYDNLNEHEDLLHFLQAYNGSRIRGEVPSVPVSQPRLGK